MTAPSHPSGTLICCCWCSGVLPRPGVCRAGGSRSRARERPRVPCWGAGLSSKLVGNRQGQGGQGRACEELRGCGGLRHGMAASWSLCPSDPSLPSLGTLPHGCQPAGWGNRPCLKSCLAAWPFAAAMDKGLRWLCGSLGTPGQSPRTCPDLSVSRMGRWGGPPHASLSRGSPTVSPQGPLHLRGWLR